MGYVGWWGKFTKNISAKICVHVNDLLVKWNCVEVLSVKNLQYSNGQDQLLPKFVSRHWAKGLLTCDVMIFFWKYLLVISVPSPEIYRNDLIWDRCRMLVKFHNHYIVYKSLFNRHLQSLYKHTLLDIFLLTSIHLVKYEHIFLPQRSLQSLCYLSIRVRH